MRAVVTALFVKSVSGLNRRGHGAEGAMTIAIVTMTTTMTMTMIAIAPG